MSDRASNAAIEIYDLYEDFDNDDVDTFGVSEIAEIIRSHFSTDSELLEDTPTIKSLRDRCEANVISFSNDDVSELLVEIERLRAAIEAEGKVGK